MKTGSKEVKKFIMVSQPGSTGIPQEKITRSSDTYRILRQVHLREGNEMQEFFYVLFLNRANMPTGYYFASMGGVTGTVADPRLIIKAASLVNCTSMVLCHNHPSGNLVPSTADEELTKKIKQAASYFDIKVLDHLILSEDNGYYSFADEGIM